MLHHLTISHYALIESLDIDWNTGFSVITGETGAGKSIMLGALNLLLGGRAETKAIQTGQKKCLVEAFFNIEGLGLEPFFEQNNIDYDATDCIIRREVMQSGKSRAFINDTPVPVSKLREVGALLIDIHSQHQNLLIQNEHFLIETLDVMAAQPNIVSKYIESYLQCKSVELQLKKLKEDAEKGRAEQEYNQFILSQIEDAHLISDEQGDLEQEQHVLGHAEDIKRALTTAEGLLDSDELSVIQHLKRAEETLNTVSDHYENASSLAKRIQSVRIELDDVDAELSQCAEHVEFDPERLSFVEERLNTIYNLEQKHHVNDVQGLLDLAKELRQKIDEVENVDDDISKLTTKLDSLIAERNRCAADLTESRKRAAKILEKELTSSLQELGMPNVRLEVNITSRAAYDRSGGDNVVFLFSANKNVELQDVSKIASGGEIARLMLSLKSLIAKRKNLPTIIFDEIDTGVSGTMAQRMAQVMKDIAENCQVICITHLPQIAAMGDKHYRVYKEDSQDMTRSHIVPLTEKERVDEIAHMLSGEVLSDAAINNAKELLNH